jgi:hypothetical protein
MLCACLSLETTIKIVNWSRWGLYATSVHTAPGFKSAIKSLQSIRPAKPLDYIPVPVEVRQRAYTVSPAFAKLKPYLDGEMARGWTVHSRPFTDSKGLSGLDEKEISAGWFYWSLYDSVVAAGCHSDPGEADRFLAQVGDEIRSAITDGRLPGRWVPVAMVDPAWAQWLPRLPQSLYRIGRTFNRPAVPGFPFDRFSEKVVGSNFDQYANRRSYLNPRLSAKAEIAGWAVADAGEIQAVEIRSAAGTILGRTPLDIPRPDIDPSRPVGFRVSFVVPSEKPEQQLEIVVLLKDGREGRRMLAAIPAAQVKHIPAGNTLVQIGLDRIRMPKVSRLWKAQTDIESFYLTLQSRLLWPGCFAAMAVVILAVYQRRPIDLSIAILAVAVATRMLFFAIIDASAWPGYQPRYLYPVYPLFSLLLVLVYARAFSLPRLREKGS